MVLFIFPHHLLMDFAFPQWMLVMGQVIGYLNTVPILVVTGYGALMIGMLLLLGLCVSLDYTLDPLIVGAPYAMQLILETAEPRSVQGVDASPGFVAYAAAHVADRRASFAVADIQSLPLAAARPVSWLAP